MTSQWVKGGEGKMHVEHEQVTTAVLALTNSCQMRP